MRAATALMLIVAVVPAAAQDRCDNCGQLVSIQRVSTKTDWTPLGSMPAMSEFAGQPGRVSTQYNFATGNVVMLGAAGGAGYAKRSNAYERPRWELAVKMDRGDTRKLTQDYEPALREGDRVRVYGTQVELLQ